ncbi:MAG: hypothetical protein JSR44_01955, partial [Spirochaetes bacterium]|nr:hypothetical protein [Spirochaetota bacterium]
MLACIDRCNKLEVLDVNFRAPEITATMPVDTVPPSISAGISFSGVAPDSLMVHWGVASDNVDAAATLQYKLVVDTGGVSNINTLALAEAKIGADVLLDWSTATTSFAVVSLQPWMTYHFAVLVRDAAANKTLYTPVSQTTLPHGTVDTSFDPGQGTSAIIRVIQLQSDGKILIGGDFISYNGTTRNRAARLNSDATLDTSFNPGTVNGSITTYALQNDGKIIVGGAFTSYYGYAVNRIVRALADGSIDLAFNPGTGADNVVYATLVQSDGKIVIAGNFTTYNGTSRNRIARINSNATLDTTFDPGTGADDIVMALAQQSDGKIFIGGHFNTYNGIARSRIARLNTDGSVDSTFDSGSDNRGDVNKLALQNDGKILMTGTIWQYKGSGSNSILSVLPDGSFDVQFGSTFCASSIDNLSLQSDGKIIIACNYYVGGTPRINIARLNSDGSIDTAWDIGTGGENAVLGLAQQSDGKILVGGSFTSYNGTPRNGIV